MLRIHFCNKVFVFLLQHLLSQRIKYGVHFSPYVLLSCLGVRRCERRACRRLFEVSELATEVMSLQMSNEISLLLFCGAVTEHTSTRTTTEPHVYMPAS